MPRWQDLRGRFRVIIQSGIIGTFIGILPGLGADMGAWISYDAAKRTSREREKYGKGSIEGVIAAETGNNAVVPGSLIPVIALGLPGSARCRDHHGGAVPARPASPGRPSCSTMSACSNTWSSAW